MPWLRRYGALFLAIVMLGTLGGFWIACLVWAVTTGGQR